MTGRATRKTAPQPVARPNRSAASGLPIPRAEYGWCGALRCVSAASQGVAAEGRRQGTAFARLPARFCLPRTAADEPSIANRRGSENSRLPAQEAGWGQGQWGSGGRSPRTRSAAAGAAASADGPGPPPLRTAAPRRLPGCPAPAGLASYLLDEAAPVLQGGAA